MNPSICMNFPGWCTFSQTHKTVDIPKSAQLTLKEREEAGIDRVFGKRTITDAQEGHLVTPRSQDFSTKKGKAKATTAAVREWSCPRCTFNNVGDLSDCEACGGPNVRWELANRNILSQMQLQQSIQVAQQHKAQELKADALRDVLEDLGSSDDESQPAQTTGSSLLPGHQKPQAPVGMDTAQDQAPPVLAPYMSTDECVVMLVPAELLLRCMSYLCDWKDYGRLRVVCRSWCPLLEDGRAGQQLWGPEYHRMSQAGAIQDTPGSAAKQQQQQRKKYNLDNLGPATTDRSETQTPPTTPSSAQALRSGSRRLAATPPSTPGGSVGAGLSVSRGQLRLASICGVCGLTQRQAYKGRSCEMCGAERDLLFEEPMRQAYTRVCLQDDSQGASAGGSSSGGNGAGSSKGDLRGGVSGSQAADKGCGQPTPHSLDAQDYDPNSYFLLKQAVIERKLALQWGSLHKGWEWLQASVRSMLHTRLSQDSPADEPPAAAQREACPAVGGEAPAALRISGSLGIGYSAQEAGVGVLEREQHGTLVRILKKLTDRNWVLLYESLKTEFGLQAEALARELLRRILQQSSTAGAAPATQGAGFMDAQSGWSLVEEVLTAWEAYQEWCEAVDEYCESLNENISAERHRYVQGCEAISQQTPFIRDAGLLAFRNNFILNIRICVALRSLVMDQTAAAVLAEGTGGDADSSVQGWAQAGSGQQEAGAGHGLLQGDDDVFFTDEELVQDSRVLDFSVQNSGKSSSSGHSKGRGDVQYYDWFLTKMEGHVQDILHGDAVHSHSAHKRARTAAASFTATAGASKVPPPPATGGVAQDAATGSEAASLHEQLLQQLLNVCEELDVPDDNVARDRKTQGVMRRLLLLPLRRWQSAVMVEPEARQPPSLLLANINTSTRRARRRAAGCNGTGLLQTHSQEAARYAAKADAQDSWQKLSKVFS